jgi:hypothetical protein
VRVRIANRVSVSTNSLMGIVGFFESSLKGTVSPSLGM